MLRSILLSSFLFAALFATASKITVSGQLNSNTTWSADSVLITGTIVIENGVVLKIDSGVNILGGQIDIKGAIQANGTVDYPIIFKHFDNGNTADYKPFWGMKWTDVNPANDSSWFNYCSFEKIGNDPLFEIRSTDQVAIRNCVFDGNVIKNEFFLSVFNSAIVFNDNVIKNFRSKAIEFAGGNPKIKRNKFDSCLNYQWGSDLIYFGAGMQTFQGNELTNCGDANNPSKTSSLLLISNGSTAIVQANSFKNSAFLALRIEGGSAPQIIENQIKDCFAGVLLSKTHANNKVTFRKTVIDGIEDAGVYAGIDVRAEFIDCSIKNCKKSGLTVVRDSDFDFVRDSFINNEGCGLYVAYNTTSINVDECYFNGNSANYGGGIFLADRSNSVVKNCIFENNIAAVGGGLSAGSGSGIQNCTFANNEAYNFGGGAFVQGCTFINNTLTNNKAYMGGGLATQASSYYKSVYENNYLAKNYADSLGGGAIIVVDRYIKFRNNHIENNKANYAGGGLTVFVASKSWISGLLINNNEAPFGAGIDFEANANNELKLSNNSIVYNHSSKKYGAMRNKSKDELFFTNTVFWGNESDNGLDFFSEWDNLDPWFENCVIEGGKDNFDLNGGNYNGTWKNVDENDPKFNAIAKAGIDTVAFISYFFPSNSNLYNLGKADTSGLRVAKNDLIGQKRIKYGRIDIGAIEFLSQPNAVLTGPSNTNICQGRNIILSLSGADESKVEWYKDGKLISTLNGGFTISNFSSNDAGNYWVIAANTAGVSYSDTLRLTFQKGPQVILVAKDTALCVNNDYLIRVEGAFSNYAWSNGDSDYEINPKTDGEYWVDATDANTGCAGRSDTVLISITKPSLANDVSLKQVGAEWRLYADFDQNDGFDSVLWHNKTENWKQTSTREFILVSPTNGDGAYALTCYLGQCEGDIAQDFNIVFPSTGLLKEFKLDVRQSKGQLVLNTSELATLQVSLFDLKGKEIINTTFNQNTQIEVGNYKNEIVLIKIQNPETNKVWIDKLYIK